MVGKVFIPNFSGRRTQTPDELAEKLRNQYPAEVPPVPGPIAAQRAIDQIVPNPAEVPSLPAEGIPGVRADSPLEDTSSVEDLARASQSPFAGRERMQIVYDGNGNPVIDPSTGDYKYEPITMGQFADERQRQLGTLGSVNPDMISDNAIDTAQNIMQDKVLSSSETAARYRKGLLDPNVTHEDISEWAKEEGNALSILTSRAESSLFGNDAFIRSVDTGYEGMPAGAVELAKLGLYDPEHVRMFSTLTGAATALAVGQLTMFKKGDSPVPISQDGREMDDARPVVDVVNSTAVSLKNALEKMGYAIPMENVRKIASAHVLGQMQDRNLIPNKDRNGRQVVSASPEMKTIARTMAYTAEALAGDTKRSPPTRTPQIGGSDFRNPGSQTTANAKPGVKHVVADMVKDIMGSVAYTYRPRDVQYKSIEIEDIIAHAVTDNAGKMMYSNSVFAKRNKVSKSHYDSLKGKANPRADYDANNPAHVKEFAEQQHEHAVNEINNKITSLQYDVKNANSLPGVFYISHIHSTANQRFFENSSMADAMSSKSGVREMRNFAKQDLIRPVDLFDPKQVEAIKGRALGIFKLKGKSRAKAFESLPPSEQGAIAAMMAAVVNYYTVAADSSVHDKTIIKQSESTQLQKYTVEIGQRLAELGREYDAFLKDPKGDTHDNIKSYLGGMPTGEALGNKNLWDDMASLHARALGTSSKMVPYQMSYLNFDDGNQNGIFLQSLFFGNSLSAKMLGTFNPRLGDMRDYATRVIGANIESMFYDNPEKVAAWKEFFKAAAKNDSFSSDLFKKPLMQNSYSMDAGMFGDEVDAFLDDETYNTIAVSTLIGSGIYDSVRSASAELNLALEATLREIVNQEYARIMMGAGRYSAVMGQSLEITNVDGDMMYLAPVSLQPIHDPFKDEEGISREDGHIIRERGLKTDDFVTSSGEKVAVPITNRRENPNYSKGTIRYWNKSKNQYDEFNNYTGSSLSRYLVVMPIQGADGGLVKLTMLAVNKGKPIPEPAAFVHDAINAPGSSALKYRNAYNNIAIPQAIEEIAKFGKKLGAAVQKAEDRMKTTVGNMSAVGIGEDGDYPSLGALFDENYAKFKEDGSYKQRFLEKSSTQYLASNSGKTREEANSYAQKKWQEYKSKVQPKIDEAVALGWKPPGTIDENQRRNLAVRPDKFLKLVDIAADLLRIKGPNAAFPSFVNNFEGNVNRTKKDLAGDALVKAAGIAQMTTSGGGSKLDVSKLPKKPERDITKRPSKSLINSIALDNQKEAGWDPNWPFIPADLTNPDFRELIRKDPSLTDKQKESILTAGYKLGVVPLSDISKTKVSKPDAEGIPKRESKPKLGNPANGLFTKESPEDRKQRVQSMREKYGFGDDEIPF